jgi:hypothetical protein
MKDQSPTSNVSCPHAQEKAVAKLKMTFFQNRERLREKERVPTQTSPHFPGFSENEIDQ